MKRRSFLTATAAAVAGLFGGTRPAAAKAPGRVYDIRPDLSRGERPGKGLRVYARAGGLVPIKYVARVEFDADGDTGPATVTALIHPFFPGPDGKFARFRFRCHAAVTTAGVGA